MSRSFVGCCCCLFVEPVSFVVSSRSVEETWEAREDSKKNKKPVKEKMIVITMSNIVIKALKTSFEHILLSHHHS